MKKLTVLILALLVSGAAYAASSRPPYGFSLAIVTESGETPRPSAGGNLRNVPFTAESRPSRPGGWGDQQAGVRTSGPAEFHLGRLARTHRTTRIVRGVCLLGLGGVGIAGGVEAVSANTGFWFFDALGKVGGTALIILGSAMAIGGIFDLAAPSRAEREYRDATQISDPEQREKACRLVLPELADKGRRTRIITGIACTVLSVVCLASSGEDEGASSLAVGGVFGGLAAYSFLVKSPAERALRNYERETGTSKTTQFAFGVGPRGRVQATLLVSY